MHKIKFSKNWNNKLNNTYFTTIRLHTLDKYYYYKGAINETFDILLKGVSLKQVELISMRLITIAKLCTLDLNYTDAGLNSEDFYILMSRMYSGKGKYWDGINTNMLLLTFKSIGGGLPNIRVDPAKIDHLEKGAQLNLRN